jgi:hypothetical protein
MDVVAAPVSGFVARGSAAYLYDPHAPPLDPSGRDVIENPSILCLNARGLGRLTLPGTPAPARATG